MAVPHFVCLLDLQLWSGVALDGVDRLRRDTVQVASSELLGEEKRFEEKVKKRGVEFRKKTEASSGRCQLRSTTKMRKSRKSRRTLRKRR